MISPRSRRTLIMFSSPNGLMVVSIVKMYQELKYERLTSLFLVVFSEIGILYEGTVRNVNILHRDFGIFSYNRFYFFI